MNGAISDLIFIVQEALTPQQSPYPGLSHHEGTGLVGTCGVQPSADSWQIDLAADRCLSLRQGYMGRGEDAVQDGSDVDLGISHHPAFSLMAPFSVTNR